MTVAGLATRRGLGWVVMVLVAGLATTAVGVVAAHAAEHRTAAEAMRRRADLTAAAVRGDVLRYQETLAGAAAALSAQQDLERADFNTITRPLLDARLRGSSGVTFVVPAGITQTRSVQDYWRRHGAVGLLLRPVPPPAGTAPVHVYSVFTRSLDGVTATLGVDLSQIPELNQAMSLSDRSDRIAVSSPYVLSKDRALPPARRQLSLVLLAEVTDPAGGHLRGWLLMGLRTGDLLAQALEQTGQNSLNATLTSQQANSGALTLTRQEVGRASDPSLVRRAQIPVGQQQWTLIVQGTDAAAGRDGGQGDLDTGVLLAGLVITGLLVLLVSMLVTSRQRALLAVERATIDLRAAEERFRFAFDHAHVGMAMIDLGPVHPGQFLRANEALCSMLGYAAEELLNCTLTDVTDITGDDPTADQLGSTGDSTTQEKRYRHREGYLVWVLVNSTIIRAADGQPVYSVTQIEDITLRRAENERLATMALTDPLTRLGNRLLLDDRLAQAAARARRSLRSVGVIYCDVDLFKPINDTYGHAAGDAVLCEVGRRLREIVRPQDTVARIGGDEFVVLCEDMNSPSATERVCTRIRSAFDQPIALPGGTHIQVTCSVGAASGTGTDIDVDKLMHEADAAMYQAKRAAAHPDRSGG